MPTNLIPPGLLKAFGRDQKRWPQIVKTAAMLNRVGLYFLAQSRLALGGIYTDGRYTVRNDFLVGQEALQEKVNEVLARYRADESAFKYFFGQPYQGLAIAGVFGDRLTDYRFDDYDLRKFIKAGDRILDIGCNCGFIGILASYRTGCHATGIDINPYMIEIGNLVANHLRLDDLVDLHAGRLQDFKPERPFDVVLSFATHWTDDNNYRVSIEDHMERMASYLRSGGTLVFETHCNDVGHAEFYEALERAKQWFSFDGLYKKTDNDTRELYVMRRH